MAQILGYLSDDEASAFQQYAAELRLDVTALANLLIVRELRRERLAALRPLHDRDLGGQGKKKIVAHQSDPETKAAFKAHAIRSEEHTSELQSLMRISYAVFSLNKKKYESQSYTKCKSTKQ